MKKKKPIKNSVGTGPFGNALFGSQNPWEEQLSKTTTLFKNLRYSLVSNERNLLAQCYVEVSLIKIIVDIPVEDGLRGGIEITTKQLSTEQLQELQTTLRRQNDLGVMAQALKWNRLFGGAGIIILDGEPVETEIDFTKVKQDSELEFFAVDMWELYHNHPQNGTDKLKDIPEDEFYTYYGTKVHTSRVIKLKGEAAPNWISQLLRGWGLSVVETLVRSINQYLKANNLGFEVLDEFKLDIFKIKGLTSTLLKAGGVEQIQRRLSLANRQKNYQNALTMDAEDDHQQKQLSFTGIAEAMTGIRLQVAADMRMPLTKLFGQSSAGFNSGEDDIENYNSMIESQIRSKAEFEILKMLEYRCMQMFGMIPDDLNISFKPLRVLSSKDEEEIKTQKFNRLMQASTAGQMTTKEFKDACNKGKLFDVQIDTSIETLDVQPDEPEEDLPDAEIEDNAQYLNTKEKRVQ